MAFGYVSIPSSAQNIAFSGASILELNTQGQRVRISLQDLSIILIPVFGLIHTVMPLDSVWYTHCKTYITK